MNGMEMWRLSAISISSSIRLSGFFDFSLFAQLDTNHNFTTMTSASVFLRRLALPAASKGTQQQLRLASSVGVASTLPSSPSAPSGTTTPAGNIGSRRGMATISAGDALARLATDHPHQEIIRYEHKNVKWTLKHVNYYSDALACGLVDAGLQPGDVVLSWLPMHFAEQVS